MRFKGGLLVGTMVVTSWLGARPADACAVFTEATGNAPVSDHKMLLVLSPQSTTLYDQVRYTGSPTSFAWVLPVKGMVTIGLSADAAFGTLDALTASKIEEPAGCPVPAGCERIPEDFQNGGSDGGLGTDKGGVIVEQHMVIGPYDTVVLKATDPMALTDWLTKNGYAIPMNVQPLFVTYVSDGFDFVAMKLIPGAGVDRMRPVRITTQGASAQIPMRAVAAGTGNSVGVTMWILSQGFYEPTNYPTFYVGSNDLTWDFATAASDFDALRAQKAQAFGGLGLEIESETNVLLGRIETGIQINGKYDADGTMSDDLKVLTGPFSVDGSVHVTRLRGDLSRKALENDLQLSAAASQAGLSKDRLPSRTINMKCSNDCPSGYRLKTGNGISGGGGCDTSGEQGSWMAGVAMLGLAALARRRKTSA